MWGGVKVRRQYGDHFRNWSATKGLDELRRALYQEPRPWYLAFGLHQRQHLLQDHHCARLMAWCTTAVQLRTTAEAKRAAYKYAQEAFGLLVHSHKVGVETIFDYMRLCAVGRDLTTAYEWHCYWLDAKPDGGAGSGAALLRQYSWLLRIACEGPSDEAVEDMAAAVLEGYNERCCSRVMDEATGEVVLAHFQPTTPDEEAALRGFFCAFKAVEPRLTAAPVGGQPGTTAEGAWSFARALPVTREEAVRWLESGWPTSSHAHTFPHLEGGQAVPACTPARPCLRDSLLSAEFVARLEEAAFTRRDVAAVVAALKWYQTSVTMERDRADSASRLSHQRSLDGSPMDVWRQYADPSAQRMRANVVAAGGLTPELYHYVIAALAQAQPTAVLRTLARMEAANLRVLDVTRAVALIAAQGSFDDQLRLFRAQLAEVRARAKLDEDHDICKRLEVWWKYQYTDFFHYMNAMDREAFYVFLMDGLPDGPHAVQQLLLASGEAGATATEEEDLVLLDSDLCRAAVRHFRSRLGAASVDTALDIVTRHMPKLDVTLVGSLPHFTDYALPAGDDIATDAATLGAKLKPYDTVYVLDASFVETGEAFLELGQRREPGEVGRTLVLVPYVTLAQLGDSVASAHHFVTFDPALAEAVSGEPFLASQRLRALFARIQQRPPVVGSADADPMAVRVLHLTECLLAHGLSRDLVEKQLGLRPATSDDDHLLLVLSLLRTLVRSDARVVLCSDDPGMARRLQTQDASTAEGAADGPASLAPLFCGPVELLTTQPPDAVDVAAGTINDNPLLHFDAARFTPKLELSRALKSTPVAASLAGGVDREVACASATGGSPESESIDSDDPLAHSPWLAMLDDGFEAAAEAATPVTPPAAQPAPSVVKDAGGLALAAPNPEDLMDVYESPHDVVPVGEVMREADELGSVFAQFDVPTPEEAEQQALDREAGRSRLQPGGGAVGGKRRRSMLEREMLNNRGASYKERRQMARTLSNMSGGRVPFNLRYRVVEANVSDPRNAALRQKYEDGLRKKRDFYHRRS